MSSKNCLIVANSFKDASSVLGKEISSFLSDRGWNVRVFSYNGQDALENAVKTSFEGMSLVVTLGGDGTVLFASRGCAPLGIPVFAVNLGEFGFLAGIKKDNWRKSLQDFLDGKSSLSRRHMVRCVVERDGKDVFHCSGMNDVTVSSTAASRLINVDVSYADAFLGPFKANGLIIATATGSTAYSAAAGGPIMSPPLDALVLTPISSFSLSARPLVFSSEEKIAVTVKPSRVSVHLSVDGQINFDLQEKDRVLLYIPEYSVTLVGYTLETFYSALQSKLNWSGGPRA
ncbi:MAG TPA: NAD(+) kinase [Treponema sp.]|nr:NAD(+)/NADH kinase [Treponema sp.]HAK68032.1 NAD(+) kinase [Treponema sp.]HCA19168.1 NAD(+) kinase [Treponema sp.]